MKRLLFILVLLPVFVDGQIITTVAGGGTSIGDGGPATSANLGTFGNIAFDNYGNLYIAENNQDRVRKVDKLTNIITTVAGTGSSGFSGESGLATNAKLSAPTEVAFDRFNNLYISDDGNNRIRKVDAASGIITTIAGTGTSSFSGNGGPAIDASFGGVEQLEFDTLGNLYFAAAARVLKIDTNGILSTIVGNGTTGFYGDGGPADSSELNQPWGICLDMLNNLYVSDQGNNRVRKVNLSTNIITTIAGNGTSSYSTQC